MEKLVGDPIYIYLADDCEVILEDGGYRWIVYDAEEEFVPYEGAAEFFIANGREDIGKLIATGMTYRYGKYQPL